MTFTIPHTRNRAPTNTTKNRRRVLQGAREELWSEGVPQGTDELHLVVSPDSKPSLKIS